MFHKHILSSLSVKPLIAYTNPFINAQEGSDVDLNCMVLQGFPVPSVQWQRNKQVLSVCLSVCPSVCLSICPSVCLINAQEGSDVDLNCMVLQGFPVPSVQWQRNKQVLSVCLSVHPSVCPSVHLSVLSMPRREVM